MKPNSPFSQRVRPWVSQATRILGWVGLFILVYVLSTGPVVWVTYQLRNWSLLGVAEDVYAPLIWLADQSEPVEEFLEWYLDLWVDL